MAISVALEKLIAEQTPGTLAKWWCVLNNWGWPKEIPNQEDPQDRTHGRRSGIMDSITARIGFKACLREWNENMTDDEFEAFWNRSFHQTTGALKV